MGKGYAEGSAMEERLAALERGDRDTEQPPTRLAVYGSTEAEPARHFLGWADGWTPTSCSAPGFTRVVWRGRASRARETESLFLW